MPIRWRLTLFNALAIGAIMLASGLSLFVSLRAALLSGVEKTARESALAAANIVDSGEALHRDEMERFSLHGAFILVRGNDGRVLTRTVDLPDHAEERDSIWRRALRNDQPAGGTLQITEDAPVYVYAVPVDPLRGPARVVEAGRSYQTVQRALEAFSTVFVIGALAALSLSGAYLLARAALSPVGAVVAAARKITESDLSERLPVTNPSDEIGNLTATINALLSRLEEAFARREEALLSLEEALGKQRRFVADASHELRTPLTNIEGYAEMLEEWALKNPETSRESVEAIREESRRMQQLLEQLLALARGDEGAPLEFKAQDLGSTDLDQEKYWDERDPRAKYNAVSDACWLYQDRELEQNLRRLDWRKARKRVLGRGALGREWVGRGRGELRLGRRGLEMRYTSGARVMGWKELQDFVRARRS